MLIFITTLSLLFIHLNGRVGAVNCYAFESPKTPEAILRICPTFMPGTEHFYMGDLLCTNMTHKIDGKRVIDQTCCCSGDGCNF